MIISDIRNIFEQERDYYKSIRVGNFYSSNYIEHKNNGDRDKNVSIEERLNKIKPYLKDIIINLQKLDAWKILSAISINFISSKDINEEQKMH